MNQELNSVQECEVELEKGCKILSLEAVSRLALDYKGN